MRASDLAVALRMQKDLRSGRARQRRIGLGVSGAAVARAMRPPVSPQAVFAWETAQAKPTPEHALAYARVLDRLEAGRAA